MVIYIYYYITFLFLNYPFKKKKKKTFWILGSHPLYWNQFFSKLRQKSSILSYLGLRIYNLSRALAFSLMNKCFSLKDQVKFIFGPSRPRGNQGRNIAIQRYLSISLKFQITPFLFITKHTLLDRQPSDSELSCQAS